MGNQDAETIQKLSAEMGVTTNDVTGFLLALNVWIKKGHSFEEAVALHMEQMKRLANNAVEFAKNGKPMIAGAFYEAVA